jgi:hypothetical protein
VRLSLLDQAAALAKEAAEKQFEQKQAPMFALEEVLLMSAAEIANHVIGADAALDRLKAASSALDSAARTGKTQSAETSLNGAAVYAMVAALEANRGNTKAAAEARAEGRRRLKVLDLSQVKDQAERQRLQRIRAALEELPNSNRSTKASDR